jgi:hypothetical protein
MSTFKDHKHEEKAQPKSAHEEKHVEHKVEPQVFEQFTAAQLAKEPKVQPKALVTVEHKTCNELMAKFRHQPASLAESMADYLNAKQASGATVIGCFGDTTNHYFVFSK